MMSSLMNQECIIGGQHLVTQGTIVVKTVWKMLGFNVVFDHTKLSLTVGTYLTNISCTITTLQNVFIKILRFGYEPCNNISQINNAKITTTRMYLFETIYKVDVNHSKVL